jgi:Na+-translocating ferredoxin:NAD+ oxidoreductase subunit C
MISAAASFRRLHAFPGGLRLAHHTERSTGRPLDVLSPPERVLLPLNHAGIPLAAVVKTGQRVRKGELVARGADDRAVPLHASISGTVSGIVEAPLPLPDETHGPCLGIESDGSDAWIDTGMEPFADHLSASPDALVQRIREAGIAGLGGAIYSTAAKLGSAQKIETLIINGVECEPYLSCDDMLMRSHPHKVVEGSRILRHITGAKSCIIAIEDHMHEAHAALRKALLDVSDSIELAVVPSIYPAGGERQLIQMLTGLETPSGGYPPDIGVLCQNVGTAVAVHDAVVMGRPMIGRIVTVTGEGVSRPGNFEVRLGTPIRALIDACGGRTPGSAKPIMGGPMMGFTLPGDELPVTKASNCILVLGADELVAPSASIACIRCGDCASVCPARLLPQQLHFDLLTEDHEGAERHGLFDCIECGCCAYVCPSRISLVAHYRRGKAAIHKRIEEKVRADAARERFELRKERLLRETELDARKPGEPLETPASRRAAIAAARERAAMRRKDASVRDSDE